MMPTTPTGSRVTSMSTPGRTEATRSPAMRNASPAKNLKMLPARVASPIASGRVLPSSRARRLPSSSLRASTSLPTTSSTSARRCGLAAAHVGAASRAAAMALRTCSSSARAYSATGVATSEGFSLSPVVTPVSQRPLM